MHSWEGRRKSGSLGQNMGEALKTAGDNARLFCGENVPFFKSRCNPDFELDARVRETSRNNGISILSYSVLICRLPCLKQPLLSFDFLSCHPFSLHLRADAC